jgi:acetyltransferase-like isoleucine patch superfamily enzyme
MNRFAQLLIRLLSVRGNVHLGKGVHIGPFSIITSHSSLRIGDNTYIGKFCTIEVGGTIGRGVLVGNSVGIIGRCDHEYQVPGQLLRGGSWVGTDPSLAAREENRIEIGDDVWIGFGATILSGIRIGTGAIVAAGSTVVHSVGDFDIVAGSPATRVGSRFQGEPEKIAAHLAAIHDRYES